MSNLVIVQDKFMHYRVPIYNALSKRYNLTLIYSHADDLYDKSKILFKLKKISKFKFGRFNFQYKLKNILVNEKPDVVIFMFDISYVSSFFAYLNLYKLPFKIILWGHRYSKNKFINFLKNIFLKRCDAIITYTSEDFKKMEEFQISSKKVFVAQNTVEVLNHSDCSKIKKNRFLFVGRLQKRKKITIFINAFSQIINYIDKRIKIDIIGDNHNEFEIKRLVESLGLSDRVCFHEGIVDDEILKSFFKTSYAFVSPGHVGLGVVHAFAYGIPVITCVNENHAQEFYYLNKKNSIIYENHDELPSILLDCVNNYDKNIGNNAYKSYTSFYKIDNMLKGFTDSINYVLG